MAVRAGSCSAFYTGRKKVLLRSPACPPPTLGRTWTSATGARPTLPATPMGPESRQWVPRRPSAGPRRLRLAGAPVG
eukprot:8487756-Alexandrium_andersonii.AAC.1